MQFLDLEDAKFQLHVQDPADEAQVTKYLERASFAIWDFLHPVSNPAIVDPGTPWTPDTAPAHVQAATGILLGHLWQNRGEDMAPDERVWKAVLNLLTRFRDPTVA